MTTNEIVSNVFGKDEIKKICKMAILVLDVLPESVIDEFEEVDEYSIDGAITISKRAFEILTEEELEDAGVSMDEFEVIQEKMELVETEKIEDIEVMDRDAEDIGVKLRSEHRADYREDYREEE